jgi:hypothetical protein
VSAFRWTGYCLGCHRAGVELETRYDRRARALCDRCAPGPAPPRPLPRRRPTPCDRCGLLGVHGPEHDPSKPCEIALTCDRCAG